MLTPFIFHFLASTRLPRTGPQSFRRWPSHSFPIQKCSFCYFVASEMVAKEWDHPVTSKNRRWYRNYFSGSVCTNAYGFHSLKKTRNGEKTRKTRLEATLLVTKTMHCSIKITIILINPKSKTSTLKRNIFPKICRLTFHTTHPTHSLLTLFSYWQKLKLNFPGKG